MKRLSKKLALGGLGRFFFILLLSLFTLATAHAQDAKELYKKGKELYEAKKYNEAFPILKTAADKGNKKGDATEILDDYLPPLGTEEEYYVVDEEEPAYEEGTDLSEEAE